MGLEGGSDREGAGQLGTRAGRTWQGFTPGDRRRYRRRLTRGGLCCDLGVRRLLPVNRQVEAEILRG